jgi:hypothetical protein
LNTSLCLFGTFQLLGPAGGRCWLSSTTGEPRQCLWPCVSFTKVPRHYPLPAIGAGRVYVPPQVKKKHDRHAHAPPVGTTCGGISGQKWIELCGTVCALILDIDTSGCSFSAVPRYFAVIKDSSVEQYSSPTSSIIFESTATRLRISVLSPKLHNAGAGLEGTVTTFAQQHWKVSWVGAWGENTGTTGRGHSGWTQVEDGKMLIDVDTSRAGFTSTPNYVTSLQVPYHADNAKPQFWVTGQHNVFSARENGFQVRPHSAFVRNAL